MSHHIRKNRFHHKRHMHDDEDHDEDHDDDSMRIPGPIKIILALFLMLILIMMAVPFSWIKVDPSPNPDINVQIPTNNNIPEPLDSIYDATQIRTSENIRNLAIQITSQSCPHSETCYAKALYNYVQGNIQYLSDPSYEYIQHPEATLLGAGDCEDQAILLHSLMQSIGITSRVVVIPGHAFLQINIPDAKTKYKDKEGWINLDPTCKHCEFGEIPVSSIDKQITPIY